MQLHLHISLPLLLGFLPLTLAASADDAEINFTLHPDFNSWEACVQQTLIYGFALGPASPKIDYILCTTVPCLCAADSLEKNIPAYYEQASVICEEVGGNGRMGGEQATSALKNYCELNEYTVPVVDAITTTANKGPTTTAKPSKPATADANPTDSPTGHGEPLPDDPTPVPSGEAPAKDEGGLSGGAIAGISLGVTVVGVIVAIIGVWQNRRKKDRKTAQGSYEFSPVPPSEAPTQYDQYLQNGRRW